MVCPCVRTGVVSAKRLRRRVLLLALAFLAPVLLLPAQAFASPAQHLSVPIDDPVYHLFDVARLRGILTYTPATRPYSRKYVRALLDKLDSRQDLLTASERSVLEAARTRLMQVEEAEFVVFGRTGGELAWGTGVEGTAPHVLGFFGGGIEGGIGEPLSYRVHLDVVLDRARPNMFPPYQFSKPWDGNRTGLVGRGWPGDTAVQYISQSYRFSPETAVSFVDDRIVLNWGRYRRDWGVGSGSLFLSETARPFDALDLELVFASWARLRTLVGSLGDTTPNGAEEHQKNISAHRLEVQPLSWLTLAIWDVVIWQKRFELAYLNPLTIYHSAQHGHVGDFDNAVVGGDIAVTIPAWGQWYFSLFIDEIEHDKFNQLFTFPKNMFAFQTGFHVPVTVRRLPFTSVRAQYTKIEPYTYTHHPRSTPFFPGNDEPLMSTNYTHDGENLGYYLPPNSDEFMIRVTSLPAPRFSLAATYRLIRHGDNPDLPMPYDEGREDYGIEGDIDRFLEYRNVERYPDKDFLNDGIYEHIHVASLAAGYRFSGLPLSVAAEYAFYTGDNLENIKGNSRTANLFKLGFLFEYNLLRF